MTFDHLAEKHARRGYFHKSELNRLSPEKHYLRGSSGALARFASRDRMRGSQAAPCSMPAKPFQPFVPSKRAASFRAVDRLYRDYFPDFRQPGVWGTDRSM